jgi:hypothetical protein
MFSILNHNYDMNDKQINETINNCITGLFDGSTIYYKNGELSIYDISIF